MRVILVVALAACAVALAAGDGEGVMVLEGEFLGRPGDAKRRESSARYDSMALEQSMSHVKERFQFLATQRIHCRATNP